MSPGITSVAQTQVLQLWTQKKGTPMTETKRDNNLRPHEKQASKQRRHLQTPSPAAQQPSRRFTHPTKRLPASRLDK
ncbi:hypothetical protein BHYA_0005g00150 [Botrytis hyacinthi]|uniref:Uncharacterized protein n=1 Tax=Botrytis hyacinthi TaxID=278943 RepID=A0A4Z1H7A0_9HELO|nr:hypothetical protein BHYA_0005g00150 [Botrytis hyacinthi]